MAPDAVMRMAFTSGTTGNPKGVTHSFDTTLPAGHILNGAMNVTDKEVFLVYLPLGLNWGYLTLLQSIMAGARAVLLDRFSGRAALELIERERVTFIPSAPASIIAMLNDPELARFDLSSLRVVITGGASCPVETIRTFRARMPGHLIELYGMLEPSGNVRIVGRLKEMINRGGKKFFPREVEEILYTHPGVLHAAIVGVPDPRLGERNCLCVIPRPGKSVSLQEMVAYLRDGVAAYKLPEELEIFDEFPFTPTGKIQRHALTRQVLARREHA